MASPVTLKGHMHICPMADPKPHIGGPVIWTQQNFVTVDGIPIATVGDTWICTGVPTTDGIAGGSSAANINGRKIARIGDLCNHGGKLTQGVAWITFE
ncbi:hypothetical protein GOZ83_09485 [Agrobacterium vitis]|uniref:PAAR domain-containing protein n=1 Tax=Rhizobium/Agrobacterium group TaxID=227290 RepID=UPI0012E77EA7|nr:MULTISPECIES: PAAR domain-containing protein [Rhizobium/Agrobacterium group]MCF1449285.1 hypothetical protein [Allorhizobium ampelinum]MCF1494800.1 hypothetical protein [Allorhizobium ampelinum]MVA45304.1 hypothetical protein [Agrobacterium vitis]